MVAIQSIVSVLALTVMASASPANIAARGEVAAGIKLYKVAGCNESQFQAQHTVLLPPNSGLGPDEREVGVCYSEPDYGSLKLLNIKAGCQWEKHLAGSCAGTPIQIVKDTTTCVAGETFPRNFWMVTCGH
ncbi:hypothetical protein BKA65DRAFT_156129 [Rhexocercosporidium sp. MPI-PUGE-AT-0058]|nr:hypothetical protein BKA65DRAFT_156129 [Rhexocercosporidium sp. MPI-PUGE-AT-0058]